MTEYIKKVTDVYCTVTVEGIHNWPDCPIDEVKYLRDPHRHLFVIKAYKRVNHDDRDQEFIHLQHQIRVYLLQKYAVQQSEESFDDHVCRFGAQSCEMIGRELMKEFGLCRVDVSEDNENGAIIYEENI